MDATQSPAVVIEPVNVEISNVGVTSKHIATFQTNLSTTTYRLCIHVATATTQNFDIEFDSFEVGPKPTAIGAYISDWTSFTPTGSWSTNTTYTGFWRRVGDSMEVQVKVALSGAPTTATLSINLPSGHSIDTSKFANTATGCVGYGRIFDSGSYNGIAAAYYGSTTSVEVRSLSTTVAYSMVAVTQAAPITFANGDLIDLVFQVPIQGWASSTTLSNIDSGRVVAAKMYRNAALTTLAPNNSYVKVNIDTTEFDSLGGANTSSNRYDVKEAGYYDIIGQVSIAASNVTTSAYFAAIYKNGVLIKNGSSNYQSSATQAMRLGVSTKVSCIAGDYIELYFFAQANHSASNLTVSTGANATTLEISKISSGSGTIAASEVVACKYTSSTTTIGTTTTTLVMPTKVFDTHGAYNNSTGVFTAPIAGKYRISGGYASATAITSTTANRACQIHMTKAGSASETSTCAIYYWPATSMQLGPQLWGETSFDLLAGDTLTLGATRASEVPSHSANGSSSLCWVSIERIG